MHDLLESIRQSLERVEPGLLEFSYFGLGAMLEYVFPPFPGDAIVLLGTFLVGRYGWSLPAIFIAVSIGSALGLSIDYAFGVWVLKHDAAWRQKYRFWSRLGASIDRFDAVYRRWGALCIALNRFAPAVRAAFFVAAGMSGIRYGKVLTLGLVSSLAWNCLIAFVGVSVGHNWDRLKAFLSAYAVAAWILLGAVVVALLVRHYFRRIRRARTARSAQSQRGDITKDPRSEG